MEDQIDFCCKRSVIGCSHPLFGVISVVLVLYIILFDRKPLLLTRIEGDIPDFSDMIMSSGDHPIGLNESSSTSAKPDRHTQFPSQIRSPTSDPSRLQTHISAIREARLQPPARCPNSTHYLLPTTPADHNYAPYYFRCSDISHRHHPPSFKWSIVGEGFLSKELFYDHVFKAGGTTIQQNLKMLIKQGILANLTTMGPKYIIHGIGNDPKKNTSLPKHIDIPSFYSFINNDTISFSFVRDPIDKFLSAFHEVHLRYFVTHEYLKLPFAVADKYGDKSGIQIMRMWIDAMQSRSADNELRQKRNLKFREKRKRWTRGEPGLVSSRRRLMKGQWMDAHMHPNMRFLQDQNWASNLPFNFIGDLKNLAHDLPQILEPFILDEEVKRNHTKFMELVKKRRGREVNNSDPKVSKFHIERSALSDQDVSSLCELYWLDYLCLPFDIPPQCDIDKLIEDHYGNDVVYKDCY